MSVITHYSLVYPTLSTEARKLWGDTSKKIVSDVDKFQQQDGLDDCPVVNRKSISPEANYNFFDEGAEAGIFFSPDKNEKSILAKIFFRKDKEEQAKSQLTALHRARDSGIKNVPKPIAINENILVMEYIDALSIADYCDSTNVDLSKQVSEQQVIDLLKTIDSLIMLDIDVDVGGDMANFLYREGKGFFVIDRSMKNDSDSCTSLDDLVVPEIQDCFEKLGLDTLFNSAYEKFKSKNP